MDCLIMQLQSPFLRKSQPQQCPHTAGMIEKSWPCSFPPLLPPPLPFPVGWGLRLQMPRAFIRGTY